jgi:hypothetical protein
MNKTAMQIYAHVFCGPMFSFLLGKYLEVKIARSEAKYMFNFNKKLSVPKVMALNICHQQAEVSHPLEKLVLLVFLNQLYQGLIHIQQYPPIFSIWSFVL